MGSQNLSKPTVVISVEIQRSYDRLNIFTNYFSKLEYFYPAMYSIMLKGNSDGFVAYHQFSETWDSRVQDQQEYLKYLQQKIVQA